MLYMAGVKQWIAEKNAEKKTKITEKNTGKKIGRFAAKIAKNIAKKKSPLRGENCFKKLLKINFIKIAKNEFFIFSRRKMLKKLFKKNLIFGENC